MGSTDKVRDFVRGAPELFLNKPSYHLASLNRCPSMASVIWEIEKAFEKGIFPEKVLHGTFETYLLRDREGEPLAIFKPGQGKRNNEAIREVAAYLLDIDNFAGVPPTVFTTLSHPVFGEWRYGSCQLYVHAERFVEMRTPFVQRLLPSSIRRLAILDIRLLNPDRHTSNILVKDQRLIPIDHNLALPSGFYGGHFAWLAWNGAQTPFSLSERNYIKRLDPEQERRMLMEDIGIDEAAANLFYMATLLLKLGVKKNLNAFEIGNLVVRKSHLKEGKKREWVPSKLEEIVKKVGTKSGEWRGYSHTLFQEISQVVEDATHQHKELIGAR